MGNRRRLACVALFAAVACASVAGIAREQEGIPFDLPEQSLEESLRALGKHSNLNILIDRALVAGLRAPALRMRMTADQALAWLLRGTGLAHEFVDENTVVLIRAAAKRARGAAGAPHDPQSGAQQEEPQPASGAGARTDAASHSKLVDAITVTASKLRALDQITATGSRLELTQRHTPGAIDVVDSDQITGRGLHSVKMAVDTLPGVSTGGSPGDPAELSMRGFTGSQVMVLFDGIHIGPSAIVNRPGNSFNLEKVEVLKGPASVLYGQGAIGGVVNTVSKMPRFDHSGADVLATYGSRGRTNLGFGAGTTLSDTVAVRADISRTSSDGYINGLPEQALDAAASVRWRPHEDLDLIFKVDYLDDDPSPYFGTPLLPASVVTEPLDVIESSRNYAIDKRTHDLSYNVADYTIEARQYWPKLFITWSPVEAVTLKGQAYYFHAERTWMNAETYTFNPLTRRIDRDRFLVTHDQDMYGGQLSLSRSGELLGMKATAVLGTEYSDFDFQRLRGSQQVDSVDPFDPEPGSFGSIAARSLPTYWNTWAAFVEGMLQLTPDLQLITGARYESFGVDRQNYHLDGSFDAQSSFKRSYRSTTGRIGLVYDLTRHLTSYASFSVGADPPVPVSILSLNARERHFDFANSYQTEVGFKGSSAANTADFTLSAYYIERRDFLTLLASNALANIAAQSSGGVEATVNVKLTPHWTVSANAAYTHSRFREFSDPAIGDISGNSAPNVPGWIANLWTSIRNVRSWPLELGAGIRYVGDRYGDNANTLELKGFTLMTVYAAYGLSERVLVTGRVKNLFDEAYVNWADIFYPNQVILGEPRSFEIEVVAKF